MTGEENKFKQLFKLTKANELKFRNDLIRNYSQALREIEKEVAFYASKGQLTRTEMYKYRRYENLMKSINKELSGIDGINLREIDKYVFNHYSASYYHTGYILETEYQYKLNYQQLNRQKIVNSIQNPLTRIGLQNGGQKVRNNLTSAITQSIIKGESMTDTAQRLKGVLQDNANNVYRIIRTETTRISNLGEYQSIEHAQDIGLKVKKQWVSTLSDTTRESHRALDGEIREMDEKFSNGLLYPGDPSGEAEEVINCECTMITVIEGYENAYQFRAARGVDGRNEIIPYKTYSEWEKNRVF
jgi:SPP1 gp7 family putative phage head morphogenesis protein